MTIELTNDFHNTSATCRPVPLHAGKHKISRRTAKRLWRELCGRAECCCSSLSRFGARPLPAGVDVVTEDYDRNYIVVLR